MKKIIAVFMVGVVLIVGALGCNLPTGEENNSDGEPLEIPVSESSTEGEVDSSEGFPIPERETSDSPLVAIDLGKRIQPDDLVYLGAFRLPEGSGGSDWDYSGHGLTFYPGGDPNGANDGFSGSLYGVGHDHQLYVSEISIPAPVNSRNLDDLNTATTLQPFADLNEGMFNPEEMAIPRAGIEYLPPQGDQTTAKLHFAWGQHLQGFEPSHGWAELDLSNPQAAGPWIFDGYTNYVTNDYLFEIPQEWADAYAPGMRLATGRAREGPWSGFGPGLFAYAPWQDGNPPARNAALTRLRPLLLYGVQEPTIPDIVSDESMAMDGYQDSDHWWGGAWLTAGERSAVIFVGTKALGSSWYGFANGVVWAYDCVEQSNCPEYPEWPYEDRGYWAEDYQAQIIFYDPAELAAVALGQMETWQPQPYATLVIDDVLFDPELNPVEYKRDLVGAAAFDREQGFLFVFERLADEYKSVVHVWQIANGN